MVKIQTQHPHLIELPHGCRYVIPTKLVAQARGHLVEYGVLPQNSHHIIAGYNVFTVTGHGRGAHYHPEGTKDELLIMNRGEMEVVIWLPKGGQSFHFPLKERHMLYIPAGTAHYLVARTEADMLVLATTRYEETNEVTSTPPARSTPLKITTKGCKVLTERALPSALRIVRK